MQRKISLKNKRDELNRKKGIISEEKIESYDLDERISDFIETYYKHRIKGTNSKLGEQFLLDGLKHIIEKVAVWYEFKYPDYNIDEEINKINNHDISTESDKVFSFENFISLLSSEEKKFLEEPKYPYLLTFPRNRDYFCLTEKGYIESLYIDELTKLELANKKTKKITHPELYKLFVGKHISQIERIIKNNNIKINIDTKHIAERVNEIRLKEYFRKELFNCIMYKIIERGGNRIGPKRGLLFAKEFKCRPDIPMIYGIDYNDLELSKFINAYLNLDGKENLICYEEYFWKCKRDDINVVELSEIIKKLKVDPDVKKLHLTKNKKSE